MSRFFSSDYASLTPYTPGEQPRDARYIKLNTNESPYPPSPKAVRLAAEAAEQLRLYPDPACTALTAALAEALGVAPEEVLAGNGSDEILFFAFSAFCGSNRGAAFPSISYGFYKVFARLCKVDYLELPLSAQLRVDPAAYAGLGRTIFLANPNAPTGLALPPEEIERILLANPDSVVVIDEAYVDFGAQSCVPLIRKYDNLLVVQTFSKSRNLAGARLGMAIGQPELIRDLNTVRYSLNPYNINRMTMAAGLGVLADADYSRDCCRRIVADRTYTAGRLAELGFCFPDSSTNFIFARHPRLDGRRTYEQLKARGILVRHFDDPLLRDYNRITIGTREQMDTLLAELTAILEDA